MQSKKKNILLEFILVFFIFSIPYFSGAFLYGLLDWDRIFHTPILIVSIIITYILLKQFNNIYRSAKNDN